MTAAGAPQVLRIIGVGGADAWPNLCLFLTKSGSYFELPEAVYHCCDTLTVAEVLNTDPVEA